MIALALSANQSEQLVAIARCEERGWVEVSRHDWQAFGDIRPTRTGIDVMLRATGHSEVVKSFVQRYIEKNGTTDKVSMAVLLGFAWMDVSELERWADVPLSPELEDDLEGFLATGKRLL